MVISIPAPRIVIELILTNKWTNISFNAGFDLSAHKVAKFQVMTMKVANISVACVHVRVSSNDRVFVYCM